MLRNGTDNMTIKARGRAIPTAVDVSQILTRRFANDISVKS